MLTKVFFTFVIVAQLQKSVVRVVPDPNICAKSGVRDDPAYSLLDLFWNYATLTFVRILIEVPRSGGYAKEHLDEHLGRYSICYVGNHFHILSMLVALNMSNVA